MEVEYEEVLYDFPEGTTEAEILSFFDGPPKELEKEKLEPGVYQDEEGNTFQVTSDGELVDLGDNS